MRAEADRREGLARLAGQVETGRARVESIDDGVAWLSTGIDEALRAPRRLGPSSRPQGRIGELDQGEVGLDEHHDRTMADLRLADERVTELQSAERAAERQVASLRARIEAPAVGLSAKTAQPGWWRTAAMPDCSGPWPSWSRCSPATRPRWQRFWVRRPTRWPPTASPRPVRRFRRSDADGGRAAIVLADWPGVAVREVDPPPDGARWAVDPLTRRARLRAP